MPLCTCGDADDEHGGDEKFPGSTACIFNDPNTAKEADREVCECVAFEAAPDDDGDHNFDIGPTDGD